MTVDAHHHLWDLHVRAHEWLRAPEYKPIWRDFSLEELEAEAAPLGVDKTILVQVAASSDETREFLAYAACSKTIAGVVGWTDLTDPAAKDAIAGLKASAGGQRLVGIRHLVQDEKDPEWLERADVQSGRRAVGEAGLPYDLLVRQPQTESALNVVRALPDQVFVLDHLGKPPIADGDLEPWRSWITKLAAEPNVVCKISGLVTEADWGTWTIPDLRPYTDAVIESFGPERLMFGSDWPVCVLAASYSEVYEAAASLTEALSDAERAAVFGGTATRVYGL